MKTQAAVLVELDQPLEIVELEIPPLKRGQVLVKLFYSGVCRSQINEIKGFKGHDPYLPHTLGHEGSGIVVEVGEGVSKVQTGDAVVLTWIKGKGLEQPGTLYKWGSRSVNSGAIHGVCHHL
jgi:S-(hydroxymethyl)glutathione dehydrogenase/alcohol dehydrogenase